MPMRVPVRASVQSVNE